MNEQTQEVKVKIAFIHILNYRPNKIDVVVFFREKNPKQLWLT